MPAIHGSQYVMLTVLVVLAWESSALFVRADGPPMEPGPVQRWAVVVGAERYKNLDNVTNAHSDAERMLAALTKAHFTTTRYLEDPPTKQHIYDYVKEIAIASRPPAEPAVVVFFFAGHGFQSGGHNFLVPVDAGAGEDQLLRDSAQVAQIIQILLSDQPQPAVGPRLTILFLDACRTLKADGKVAPLPGVKEPGFAPLLNPAGTILSFASEFGKPALSAFPEESESSPFSTRLKPLVAERGVSLDDLFLALQLNVLGDTGDRQKPISVGIDTDARYFRFTKTQEDRDGEFQRWKLARDSNRSDCIEDYIRKNPDSDYMREALLLDGQRHRLPRGDASDCPRP